MDHMNEGHKHQVDLERDHPAHYFKDVHVESLATNLQGIYTQSEAILKSSLQEIDAYVPTADSWHRDLLLQASIASDERPAIITGATRDDLSELLGFRHAVRNNYASKLRHADVFRNVAIAQTTVPAFVAEVEVFLEDFDGSGNGNKPNTSKE